MASTEDILTMLATQKNKEHNQNHTGQTFLKTLSDAAYELQAYRDIGTVEEFRAYKDIGTVEEFRLLKSQSVS